MKKIALCLSGIALIAVLSACGGNKTATPAPGGTTGGTTTGGATTPAPGSAAGGATAGTVDAQAVFKQNCIACHGDNLEGKMGGNTNLQKVGSRRTRDQIAAQINNGGNGMMAFKGKLSDNEINSLADWLAAKK